MRQLRNFQTDMCYHLISRVAHRAFYLDAYEPFARRASVRPRGAFAAADISPDGEGQEGADMKLLHHSYSTNGVRPSAPSLAVRIGTETYMALTDIQGTVWGYVDSQNNIVARWTYDAWGNGLSENVTTSALASVRYRFPGRERSQATGLTNFRMRWYDSETGRWLSKDPIGLGGGLNSYEFCEASPLINMDCFGEDVYVPDNSKHGQPHVDRYHGSQNIGRYRKDGTGIPHKGKMPPRIPMSERGRFLAAASKLRCAGNILAWIPGILDDIDRISRAKENGRTYKEQLDKELDETQYLDTPFGIIPNPCYKGPLML